MELTVYRQASKTRPDGTVVYKGEDARPFVDEHFMLVADGLGGAAAIRHQNIKPELFESDKLIDTFFAGVYEYENYSDERFARYLKDSFFELFAVKDCYTDNVNNIKKSGYFASRIVAAILFLNVLCNPKFSADTLLDHLATIDQEEMRKELADKIGESYAEIIGRDLKKVAANANLIYESSYSGLALLGTTLCATMYTEEGSSVRAMYLMAGDSRPYVWTAEEGLCQVLADEEGADGGMTNYIKANEDAAFSINCVYKEFDQPCVLFNASDGCFDSGYFLSPMTYEKVILEKALASESPEEMGKLLEEFFLEYGRHDDSSTMAMKFFGYADFAAFKDAAAKRLKDMEERYFSCLEGLLERDYAAEYEEACRAAEKAAAAAEAEQEATGENVIGSPADAGAATETAEAAEETPAGNESSELAEKARIQKEVFDAYDAVYGRYMREE